MLISRALLNELIAHAREEAPNECCGIVALERSGDGEPRRAVRVHRAVNLAESPLRFEVDAETLLWAHREIEERGQAMAIYHSHTRTAPYPSQTDINFAANWPDVEWLIVSLADDEPEVRSYSIDGADVREVGVHEAGA